jgi:hypothetical protein
MDTEGFEKWLGTTHLVPHSQRNASAYCREIEPLVGDLDEVVCDPDHMENALDWLMDHADEYVLKGKQKLVGAKSRRWALRKYRDFFHSPKAMFATAGS